MLWTKIKKTLTISSNLKKKIDTSSISTSGKKSFSVEKKTYRSNKVFNKSSPTQNVNYNPDDKKETLQESLLSNKQQKILLKKIISPREKVNLSLKDQSINVTLS